MNSRDLCSSVLLNISAESRTVSEIDDEVAEDW